MAEFLRRDMPKDWRAILTGDWHVGSKGFHRRAAEQIVRRVSEEDDLYIWDGGDSIEGKPVRSKHFDPHSLDRDLITIEDQLREYLRIVAPIPRDKWLGKGAGNHDIYLAPDADVHGRICAELGIKAGGYQTWIEAGPLRLFAYHGYATMPQGAKDTVQREANQLAWLKRTLVRTGADSSHVMIMHHVHALKVLPPTRKYGLVNAGKNVHATHYVEPETVVDGAPFVPPDSRWYCIAGTLRRSGGFGWIDYSELRGFEPAPIGYLELEVRDGRVASIEPVIV